MYIFFGSISVGFLIGLICAGVSESLQIKYPIKRS